MRIQFLLLLLPLGLLGCTSNPTGEDSSEPVTLVGHWLWVQSSGGLQGKNVTPGPGVRLVVTFTNDGQYYRHLNGALQFSSSYTVKKARAIYSADSLDAIMFQDSSEGKQVILQLTQDTLGLGDNMVDGYGSTFVRVAR